MKKTLIIIASSPTPAPEALELTMAMAAFDQPVSLLFSGAGVLWLARDQQPLIPDGKNPARIIQALPMYDCDQVFVDANSLPDFGLSADDLLEISQQLTSEQQQALLASHDHCLRF